MSVLNQDQIETFKRDGVVLLEGIFDDWIETLRAGVDNNMADPGPYGRDYLDDGQAGSSEKRTDDLKLG
jgi:hypothetical protein